MVVVSSETSGCDLPFLVSRNWCRDLNSMPRPHSLCLYCISLSRPRFNVATSFLLSSSLLLGHSFSFMLRHPSIVLNFQAGRDSKLLVCLFSCRDVDIRSLPSIFFNNCNYCREPQNYVGTIPSSYPVATSFLNLNDFLQFFYFWSRLDCSALFWNICRDLDLISRHQFLLPVMLIFVATMFF